MTGWRILCYHFVDPGLRCAFGRQLDSFMQRGWRFCTISEGLNRLHSGQISKGEKLLSVSFDDGDHTVCNVAQHELDTRGIKAMLYLTTDFVSKAEIYNLTPPRRAVNCDQLGLWLEAGHEIGSHTHTHCNLAIGSIEQIREELYNSITNMKRNLGVTPVHLSYPWGQYNQKICRELVQLNQWKSAATIDRGWNSVGISPFMLKRDLIEPDWSYFKSSTRLLLGGHQLLYSLQRRLRTLSIPGR